MDRLKLDRICCICNKRCTCVIKISHFDPLKCVLLCCMWDQDSSAVCYYVWLFWWSYTSTRRETLCMRVIQNPCSLMVCDLLYSPPCTNCTCKGKSQQTVFGVCALLVFLNQFSCQNMKNIIFSLLNWILPKLMFLYYPELFESHQQMRSWSSPVWVKTVGSMTFFFQFFPVQIYVAWVLQNSKFLCSKRYVKNLINPQEFLYNILCSNSL